MTQIRAESIACTNVEHIKPGNTNGAWGIKFYNFIISTDDIWACDWSNPLYFDFHGIDPDLFFDDNGRVYVTPERSIWGGFSKIIPEGPHIYKRGEWYYLLDAEGGTHEGHGLAMARSRDIFGPDESWPEIAQPITLSLPDKLLTREPVPQKADPRHEPLWIRNIDLTAFEPISFVGKRQRNLQGMISVNLSLSQSIGGTRMKAGLAYYGDEHRIARVYFKISTVSVWTDVRNSGRRPSILRNREVVKLDKHQIEHAENIDFRIQFTEMALDLQYSLRLTDGSYDDGWVDAGSADILDLTDRDFTGPCFGVFATTKSIVKGDGNGVDPALEDGSCKAIFQKFIIE
ncbi:hypothetical protein FOMG_19500 [Fusarium oxysporum f. sp. melonis 26406]|uniref:Beta-xylosidase C-terminal Concanavalin A-like domain-containing protein n=1 Tax=Fusarium oxysporum f. sp. melonis 26406 TaxID=1089452 RepID=W9YX36_FUSOX|nr:hypothetical protein FOMG_19500 [Fusarium oxysporum f. sp. melonis 26406]